jgi:hypothetical protein
MLSMPTPRQNAQNTKPLSVDERKALVAEVAKIAPEKAKRGIALIDFREPNERERAFAETLVGRGTLARRRSQMAA